MTQQPEHVEEAVGRPAGVRWLVAAIAFVVLAWFLNLALALTTTSEARGTFGDMFGAVNAVFSGLAFAGVVYAILLQRTEVAIAREELRRTKEILSDQSAALATQNAAAEKKAFEETFFQLITLHHEILSHMDLETEPEPVTGRDVFDVMLRRLREDHGHDYAAFYAANGNEFAHYFRMLYNIVSYVDQKAPGEGRFYTNLIRAQMSEKETALMFYNGLSTPGAGFKRLIEKYHLLKHLSAADVAGNEVWVREYAPEAFGRKGIYPGWA